MSLASPVQDNSSGAHKVLAAYQRQLWQVGDKSSPQISSSGAGLLSPTCRRFLPVLASNGAAEPPSRLLRTASCTS